MPKKCDICRKQISDERLERGFDNPDPYPRTIHHDLVDTYEADYLVCSRRCHDMTFIQFKTEIVMKGFAKDKDIEIPKQEKQKQLGVAK